MTVSEGSGLEETVVEVEFEVTDPQYPLVALSAETGCEATLVQLLPRSDGEYTVFQRIIGAPPERILEFARGYDDFEARVVSATDESAIVEFRIGSDGEFFTTNLTDAGAIPTQLESADGVAHIVAEIPSTYSASDVISHFQDAYPSMTVLARRQRAYPVSLFQRQDLRDAITRLLTPRQHEALMLAFANGYYDWPRDHSGEELAAELGVSYATFSEHLRKAEHKLLSLIFTGE
ncbi:bacterio-opsin activator domain-containing protein [Natrinema sp. 74]|uniref:helix-turn-helix domain-containing protein n=1 Tax=Natrinema sp. 74 TaxID=3384159 RepID=UPI0038D4B2F8